VTDPEEPPATIGTVEAIAPVPSCRFACEADPNVETAYVAEWWTVGRRAVVLEHRGEWYRLDAGCTNGEWKWIPAREDYVRFYPAAGQMVVVR